MSIQINKRFDVSGHLVSGSLDEMQQFRDRMCGCYQIILQPFDPMLQFQLDQILELEAGPETVIDPTEIYTRDKDLILETVVKPYSPDFLNQKEPMTGTSIKVTVLPGLKYSPDHSIAYPQFALRVSINIVILVMLLIGMLSLIMDITSELCQYYLCK